MRRWRTWRWVLVGTVALVAILGLVGGNWFLRREVTSQLLAFNGARVAVHDVQLGFRQHQVHGVRLYESTDDDDVWLEIERLTVDLPVWHAIVGQTRPHRLDVTGVVTRIRLDQQGNLLTRLPGADGEIPLPADTIAVQDARLEILRPSRPPLVATSIRADIQRRGEEIHVSGSVGDALNALWSFDATANAGTSQIAGNLKTQSLRVSTDQLADEGLLTVEVSRRLRAETVTALQLQFRHHSDAQLNYQIELSPESLDVQLDQLVWTMTGGTGSIVIEDGLATVREMSGTTWGGQVAISGQADLRQHPWRGQIEADLRELTPPARLLPKDLADIALGTCSGHARLELSLQPDGVHMTGDASGTISGTGVLGISLDPMPWRLALEAPSREGDTPLSGQFRLEAAARNVDIQDVLRRLDMDVQQVIGTASLAGVLEIPLATVADPRTYYITGQVQALDANLLGTGIQDLQLSCSYDEGHLAVRDLRGHLADDGQISGQLEIDVEPGGKIDAQIDFDAVSNETVARILSSTKVRITGTSQGNLRASVPIAQWRAIETWTGSGEIACHVLQAQDLKLTDITTRFGLQDGRLTLTDGSVTWHEASLRARGEVDFLAPHQFDGHVEIGNIDLEAIAKRNGSSLPIALDGSGDLQGDIRGRLAPFTWTADGSGRLPDFIIADRNVERTQFRWRADKSGLDVHQLTADLLGGRVELATKLPWDDTSSSRLQGSFENVDASQLQDLIPAAKLILGGRVSGEVQLTHIGTPANRAGDIQFRGAEVTVYDTPVRGIGGNATYRAGRADLDIVGQVLGGTVGFRGHMPLTATDPSAVRLDGCVKLEKIQLAEFWRLINAQQRLQSVRAVAEGELDVQLVGPSYEPQAKGHLYLRHPSWGNTELTSLAEADVDLQGQDLRVTELACRAAGGIVTGNLTMRLGKLNTGTFAIGLERVALDKLTTILGGPPRRLEGRIDAAIAGRLGPEWQGKSLLRLTNAKLAGVPVSSVTTPVDWAFVPSTGRARAKVHLKSAKIAGGRVDGDVDLRWSGRWGIEASADLNSLDVQPMARATPLIADQLQGKLSGQLEIKGSNIRSVDDLSGSFQASLKQSQALMFPVLQSLTSPLGLGGSSSKMFSETAAKGHFSRGMIHVDRMTMNSQDVQMYITGKMSMRGNLNLNVTADAPQVTAVAIAVGVLRPMDLLRRRLLFLTLDGSVRSPVVRVRTAEFIQQELILFFWPFAMTP